MRTAWMTVLTAALVGCSDQTAAPFAPTPLSDAQPVPGTIVYVYVSEERIGREGSCLHGATVEIVGGEGTGRSVRMDCNYFDFWGGTGWVGFALPIERLITLRASAPGYTTQDRHVETAHRPIPDNFVNFELRRVP